MTRFDDIQQFRARNEETIENFYAAYECHALTTWYDYRIDDGVISLEEYLAKCSERGYASKIDPAENLKSLAFLITLKADAPLDEIDLPAEYEGMRILYKIGS